ncbi:hypothetical protein PCANC_04090 [Puccinia coronata f. sp. avenae]|uniref:HTH APSES-type domain-containing protein n=1 Tax=Puccinia coronata f. sp. avenae TaxID=200324 RepID=A0A2N5W202_9BASI|nr:hypothetical protein PCASD_10470 [Puccinia coronata f. sp. avenae]PLW56278.1 hypothetical protein PCANC_04090 [Puccinia coronata f. sp. avenae]
MAAVPTSSFLTSMSPQPPRTVQALVNEEARAPPPVRLYPSQHRVSMTRYATSTDPRGYIPVFEYPLNGQYIMIDCETGMVHFTGIWKALGHTKADVVKLVESDPTIAPYLRKVRGGYLKIQGTWLPFETAQTLARRVAWQIRYDLVPLFGPEFPDTCLGPGEPGFGQLLLSAPKPRGRRGAKKTAVASSIVHEKTPSINDSHNQARPGSNPPQDSMVNRRQETASAMNGYSPMLSQARYSPYTRAPSHQTTQLDPLPRLIQPNQSCPHPATDPMYPTHYDQHQNPRATMMASHGIGPYSHRPLAASQPSCMESSPPLPPMRHYQAHPAENNFFETYRGPDSFEALSNKWLAPEMSNSSSLHDPGLLNGENSCLPPPHYHNNTISRKEPSASTPESTQYNFTHQMNSTASGHPRDSNQPHHVHHNVGYSFDSQQQSNFRHDVPRDGRNHQDSSPAEQPAPSTTYDPPYNKADTRSGSHNGNSAAVCYAQPGSNSTGNQAGCAPKSPTPSAASTSTHMQNSHIPNANSSPSNTHTNMSNNGSLNAQSEEAIQFSVLTSPAHLDSNGAGDNSALQAHGSDSDWNSTQNVAGASSNQASSG